MWSDLPADGARKRLRMAIARLRETLASCARRRRRAARCARSPRGYVLDVRAGELDADVFEARVADGRRALERGDAEQASADAGRGARACGAAPALADVAYEDWAQPEIRRLEDMRLAALRGPHRRRPAARPPRRARRRARGAGRAPSDARAVRRAAHARALSLRPPDRRARRLPAHAREPARAARRSSRGRGCGRCRARCSCRRRRSTLDAPAAAGRAASGRTPAPVGLPARAPGRAGSRRRRARGDRPAAPRRRAARHRHGAGRRRQDDARDRGRPPARRRVRRRRRVRQPRGARRSGRRRRHGAARARLPAGAGHDREGHALPAARAAASSCSCSTTSSSCSPPRRCWPSCSTSAPRLKLLATSRAALDLRAEHRYSLSPLALPDSSHPATVTAAPATALFIARAAARDPAFRLTAENAEAIAAVCSRVDGLPLAIELAAARAGTLSPQEIASRLDSVLTSLGPGGARRARPPPHDARDARLELRPARRRAASRVRRAQRVRRRLHDRGGAAT